MGTSSACPVLTPELTGSEFARFSPTDFVPTDFAGTDSGMMRGMTSQTSRTGADADGLCSFVDSSPSPFHVCATVATELTAGGFVEVHETQSWPADPGRYFLVRGGSLIAWSTEGLGKTVGNTTPFRIVGDRKSVV